jgi:hypothetical protein
MTTPRPENDTINAKLLARMKMELDKPAASPIPKPRVVSERVTDYAPPDQRPDTLARALGPLPPYLTHAPGTSREAQIAAHAVGVKYEEAAQEAERKGLELHDRINGVLEETIETARHFRERGAALFRHIETCFALADEVAAGNRQMRERIASVEHIDAPAPVEADPMMREVDEPAPATNVVTGEPSRRINFDD